MGPVVTIWRASSTPGTGEHNELSGGGGWLPIFFSWLFFLFFFPFESTFLCGVFCFVPLSPTSSQHFSSQNYSCCDDVTKTDINIASVPCLLEACNTNKNHRLPRKSCASPSGCGAVRARRKTFRQSQGWSDWLQQSGSLRSSHRAWAGSACRCLSLPRHVTLGLSAEATDHAQSGEAKIFGGSGRSGTLHPGRVMLCRLWFIYFVGRDVNSCLWQLQMAGIFSLPWLLSICYPLPIRLHWP